MLRPKPNRNQFFRTREFKIFLTVWIVYIFYLQMFGSSSMANTQSALTAAIVNEGRFEIDTYHLAGSSGNALYKGHYYSGQSPGISFISVPFYLIAKPFFYILPETFIESIFSKLENFGKNLEKDFFGNEKILSNYFPTLNKNAILEYIIISGFILPIFTTALISALSSALLYHILKNFTNNERLRLLITFTYAFGTLIFPLSTEYFERPIAITLFFAAFIILFKIRHNQLKLKRSTVFTSGILAGIAVWFDYFHIFAAALLFIYLLSLFIKSKKIFPDKQRIYLLFNFILGVSIPVLLLFFYYYSIFDNPFATSYSFREISYTTITISNVINNISLGGEVPIFQIIQFFLFSPIVILALFSVFKAISVRDSYSNDSLAIAIFFIFTFTYAALLLLAYSDSPESFIPQSFKRYMTPALPFMFLFIPYLFRKNKIDKKIIKITFIVFMTLSIFMNWLSAQFGGHWALEHFNLESMKFTYIEHFLQTGPSSSFLNALSNAFVLNPLVINLAGLAILSLIIYIIWRPNRKTLISSETS
tara:strand:- start:360 stop:1964 length:1605 start_codon:yes stop_codon:yes gene_type:complete